MPLEKIAEYRIALPSRYAFDLIAKFGELGYVMLPPRPPEIPAPHIPSDIADALRRVDEVARELSKVVSSYNVAPPESPITLKFSNFAEMIRYVDEEGKEILARVSQYLTTLTELSNELNVLSRYLELLQRVGVVEIPELKYIRTDLIPLEPGEVADFRKALELHNIQVLVYDTEKPVAIVIYPVWQRETVLNIYRVFGKTPVELPREKASPEAVKTRVDELKRRVESLSEDLRKYLLSVRDRIYSVIETANAISQVVRQYTDTVVPEGEEIRARLSELKKNIEEAKRRLEEVETLERVLTELHKRKIEKFETVTIKVRLVAARGRLNREVLSRLPHMIEQIGSDTYVIILLEAPPELDVKTLVTEGVAVEIPHTYLENITAALNVISREHSELKSRIRELENELNTFIREFNKVSAYGVENLDKAGPDTVTVIAQLRARDASEFERVLANILTKLAVHAEVRKFSKYMYVPLVPKERAPTLETYPRPIDVFKKIVYWYGIPRYGEISPVPIAWFLFPFFYGWMFPDLGHGLMIAILGLLLYRWRYSGPNKVLQAIFNGRFAEWGLIFLQCGIWSMIFAVLEGGDVFGVPLDALVKGLAGAHLMHVNTATAAFAPSLMTIYLTLGLSMYVGILTMGLALLYRTINGIRLGYAYDAVSYYLPFGLFMIAASFALAVPGLIPLWVLAKSTCHELYLEAHHGYIPWAEWGLALFYSKLTDALLGSATSYVCLYGEKALEKVASVGPVAPKPDSIHVVPFGSMWLSPQAAFWITLTFVLFIYFLVRMGIDKMRHVHTHEPLMVYAVEAAECVMTWGFANVISFMRLGIIAIVHAVLTALVTWGSAQIALAAAKSGAIMAGIAFLIALGAGGFIGLLVFRVFGRGFAAGFFAFALLGGICGVLAALLGAMSVADIAWFVAALLGNICVIIFEGLVAFIQSLRLHFYELFTKHFIAGGVLFTPFRIGSPVVRIQIL